MEIYEAMRIARTHAKSLRAVADGHNSTWLADEHRKKAAALETLCGEVTRLRKELEAQRERRIRQVFEHR